MRDVTLWLALGATRDFAASNDGHAEPSPSSDDERAALDAVWLRFAADLEALSARPLTERAPFLGAAVLAARSERAGVRVAALRLLTGARGMFGLQTIIAALDDDDLQVREAAVDALRSSAEAEAARWAHAVFHPRVDVRRRALERGGPRGAESFAVYLRADPELREAARECPWPPGGLVLALRMYSRRLVEADEVARLIASQPVPELQGLLRDVFGRPSAVVRAWLQRARGSEKPPAPAGYDLMDELVAVLRHATGSGTAALERILQALETGAERVMPRRLLVSLLASGTLTTRLARVCAALDASFVHFAWVPRPLRIVACEGLLSHRSLMGLTSTTAIREILDGDVARVDGRPGAPLDPTVVSALVATTSADPLALLFELVGRDALVHHFATAPLAVASRTWAHVCRLGGADATSWMSLLEAVAKARPERAARFVAVALRWTAPQPPARSEWLLLRAKEYGVESVLHALLDGAAPSEAMTQEPSDEPWLDPVDAPLSAERARALAESSFGFVSFAGLPKVFTHALVARRRQGAAEFSSRRTCRLPVAIVAEAMRRLDEGFIEVLVDECDDEELLTLAKLVEHEVAVDAARYEVVRRGATQRSHPDLVAWCAGQTSRDATRSEEPKPADTGELALTPEERALVASCPFEKLPAVLARTLHTPRSGIAEAMSRRADEACRPSIPAVVALLGARDDVSAICRQIDRFVRDDADFLDEVVCEARIRWGRVAGVSVIGHAIAANFELHAWRLLDWIEGEGGGTLASALDRVDAMPSRFAQAWMWSGLATALAIVRARDATRCEKLLHVDVAERALDALVGARGLPAARVLKILGRLKRLEGRHEWVVQRIWAVADELSLDVRHELGDFVKIDGVAPPEIDLPSTTRRFLGLFRPDGWLAMRWASDVDELGLWCLSEDVEVVERATRRLFELGDAGELRIKALFDQPSLPKHVKVIARGIVRWGSPALEAELHRTLQRHASDPGAIERVFAIALVLTQAGSMAAWPFVLDALRLQEVRAWVTAAQWSEVLDASDDHEVLSRELVTSPHPRVYRWSVESVLSRVSAAGGSPQDVSALQDFLASGRERARDLRLSAAASLGVLGDATGTSILLTAYLDTAAETEPPRLPYVLSKIPVETRLRVLRTALDAILVGGAAVCDEPRVVSLIEGAPITPDDRRRLLRELLLWSRDDKARARVADALTTFASRDRKLYAVADTFAWGVRRGRELTGALFSVHMTSRRRDLGYTRFNEQRIYVSPMPMLTGDRNAVEIGRDVVEGLILHEFGHHMFHKGPANEAVWKEARRHGLMSLLNLVADEHLERNLRALDASYGDRLKRLAAYAFQHQDREVPVAKLLDWLVVDAFAVLTKIELGVAFDQACVVMRNDRLLLALEASGSSFARFVRALRMGQGNRSGDPRVETALALFPRGDFRRYDMKALWQVTQQLAALFGIEAEMAQAFGGHESLEWGERNGTIHGEGIGDDEIQREVERILDPRRSRAPAGDGSGRPGRHQINVSSSESFARITRVERVPRDADRHRALALETRRHSDRLREVLERLGRRPVTSGGRLQGRAFDRSRALSVVVRADPRMLIARTLEPAGDLFVGVAIDCSGSMSAGGSMNKAHRFAVMLAEAMRPLPGVEARFFGFTDTVIWDAGDARECAASSLSPGGGNNDAAGLAHVAAVAERSAKRAKLLVMISDGLPTECTVGALRGLVRDLGRRGLLCAQVAVRPLEERCFPNYVEVLGDDIDDAVKRFAAIVSSLVERALRG